MAGTTKSFAYEDLMKIWKAKGYEKNFILKPNLAYSKGCIIIDKKTGKTVREFEKNYDLFKALLSGYTPGEPWQIGGLFGNETTQSVGLNSTVVIDMAIDYAQVLELVLPTMIGEEVPKDWIERLRETRKRIRE
jgi:hypothetical protein